MTPRPRASVREARRSRTAPGLVLAGVLLLTFLVVVPNLTAAQLPARMLASVPPPAPVTGPTWVHVNYASSVDKFPLGYYIAFPTGFNASKSYPISVYLHGLMGLINATKNGGYTSDIVNSSWGNKTALAASLAGFILMAPSTRMVDGFYVNSKFTGPQEQDILDAIKDTQTRYHISGVYLFGQSMGSIGAYSVALHHPTLFKGIGIINNCDDVYAAAYWRILQGTPSQFVIELITGGTFPNQSAYAQSLFLYLSVSRYHPQNLSGLLLYEVDGGADTLCPTAPSIWSQYQQGNDTILTSTCTRIVAFNQPPNCTIPLRVLSAKFPSLYHWRYDFVMKGGHTPAILTATDLYSYWQGLVPGGKVCSNPAGTPTACP